MAPAARERRPLASSPGGGRHARERETSADDAGSCQRECPHPDGFACRGAGRWPRENWPRSAFPLRVIRSVGGPAQQHFHSMGRLGFATRLTRSTAGPPASGRHRRQRGGENASRQLLETHAASSSRLVRRCTRDLPPQSGTASHQTFQIVEIVRGLVSAAAVPPGSETTEPGRRPPRARGACCLRRSQPRTGGQAFPRVPRRKTTVSSPTPEVRHLGDHDGGHSDGAARDTEHCICRQPDR